MAASDYYFRHTDNVTNPTFVVKPYTANGPASPADPTLLYSNAGTNAISSNTSLALVGKGVTEYNVVQNNLLYLMEHFANKTRPMNPVQGQLWYKNINYDPVSIDPLYPFPTDPTTKGLYIWDGAIWNEIAVADSISSALDMDGFRVVDLGTPIADNDAATKAYADLMVPLAGGTMSGRLTLSADPTNDLHAATKQYVDNLSLNSLTDVTVSLPSLNDTLVFNGVSWSNSSTYGESYVAVAGDIMTGPLILNANPSSALGAVPKQYVDNRVINDLFDVTISTPISNDVLVFNGSAWVNSPVGGSSNDGVVYAGTLNPGTSELTLNRTAGLPDVVIADIASANHTHMAAQVALDATNPYPQTVLYPDALDSGSYPLYPVPSAFRHIDQLLTQAIRPHHRQILVGDGTTTSYTLRYDMLFVVGDNKLQVFANGIKQYMNERGRAVITFTEVAPFLTLGTDLGLSLNTLYTFSITVDGVGPTTVTITTPPTPGYTYYQLLLDIDTALTTLAIPATVNIEQCAGYMDLTFDSHTSGGGSTVLVSDGTLFAGITSSTKTFRSPVAGATYIFSTVGLPGDTSNQIIFNTPTMLNAVYEILIAP